jgi:hypothetical protein
LTQPGQDAPIAEGVEDLRRGPLQLLVPDDMGRQVVYFRRAALDQTTRRGPVLVCIAVNELYELRYTQSYPLSASQLVIYLLPGV